MLDVHLFPKKKKSYERLRLKFGTWLGQATNYGHWRRIQMNLSVWRRDFRFPFAPDIVLDRWRWRFTIPLPFCWFCTQDELRKRNENLEGKDA